MRDRFPHIFWKPVSATSCAVNLSYYSPYLCFFKRFTRFYNILPIMNSLESYFSSVLPRWDYPRCHFQALHQKRHQKAFWEPFSHLQWIFISFQIAVRSSPCNWRRFTVFIWFGLFVGFQGRRRFDLGKIIGLRDLLVTNNLVQSHGAPVFARFVGFALIWGENYVWIGQSFELIVLVKDKNGFRVCMDRFNEVRYFNNGRQVVLMAFVVFVLRTEEKVVTGEDFRGVATGYLVVVLSVVVL